MIKQLYGRMDRVALDFSKIGDLEVLQALVHLQRGFATFCVDDSTVAT